MDLNLDDPRVFLRDDVVADPRPLYDVLRRDTPVWRLPGQDTYLVADPELIREVVGRPSEFSSNLVSLLYRDDKGCPVAFGLAPFGDPIHVLATADPPIHTRHRKLLQTHLSPAAVAGLEPTVRRIVDDHLDLLLAAGRGDFVAMFSNPVPARVICDVIGLPPEDVPRLIELVADTGALLDGVTDLDGMSRAATAALDLSLYAQEQLEAARQRSAADRSGLLAVLVEAIEAGAVGPDEVRNMLVVLISAGSETTSSLLATAVETLARTPELQAHLRSSRDRIPGAIEDFLRDDGPFQFHYRWTTTDTALGGMHIPARSRVLLLWAAANRPAPDEPIASDVADAATPAAHLAFGRGLHFCIGAPLARLESRVAIEQLLARTSAILLDPDHPPTQRPSIFIRRHKTLIINIARAA